MYQHITATRSAFYQAKQRHAKRENILIAIAITLLVITSLLNGSIVQ